MAVGAASVNFALLLRAIALSGFLPTGQALRRALPQGDGLVVSLPEGLTKLARDRDPGEAWSATCLYFPGPFMGRLSNTVAMMNVAVRVAADTNARFLWPRYYTEYMAEDGFNDIFGDGDGSCWPHMVQVYPALCPANRAVKNPNMPGRCLTDRMLLNLSAPQTVSTKNMCGCKRAVQIDGQHLFWDHDYSRTYQLLSQRYWQSHSAPLLIPSKPGSLVMKSVGASKPQVVVHVRLGDVEDEQKCLKQFSLYNCQKKLQVQIYERILASLMRVLPPACAEINLVTDGAPHSPDILAISQTLTAAGWEAPHVWTGDRLSTAKTFALMTHADVLVYGPSGFGQIAAILAHPRTARIGAPLPDHYHPDPLHFLPNTTQLHRVEGGKAVPDVAKITADISTNAALMAVVARCRR